ncbi:MAG: efflux RND transporter periplasmic adaptor subunit [bacterium]
MIYIKKLLHLLKKNKYIYIFLGIILIICGIFIFNNKAINQETITVHIGDFINEVSVSGKVIPSESVDLGFYQGGRISSVRAKVGDHVYGGQILASVENGDLQADLKQKEAALLSEQAKLKSLEAGTRPEQIAVTESSVVSAQTSFDQAKQTLINYISDSYTKADDAIKNKIDQFFQNPLTNNPTIIISTNDSDLISRVNMGRSSIGKMLDLWQKSISQINPETNIDKSISDSENNLNQLKLFLAEISTITNNTNSTYSGVPIPSLWKSDTSVARLSIDTAISSMSSAITSYKNAQTDLVVKQNNLKLQQAGATQEDIQAQVAQVQVAEANVASAQATLAKTLVLAPFDGEITKMDAKVGEIASPNTSLISMMGAGTFQIESFVPEVNIAQIKLGNEAKITLDAYGSSVSFLSKVVSIDPAETIRDGISTYKIKLQFSNKDDRIKSGMTANVSITIFNKPNVIVVPGGVVFDRNGKKFIQVKINEKLLDREVITGSVSSLGQIEIISGLSDGDVVILNPQVK